MGAVQLKSSTLSQLSSQILNSSICHQFKMMRLLMPPPPPPRKLKPRRQRKLQQRLRLLLKKRKKRKQQKNKVFIPNLVINVNTYQQIQSKRWCFYRIFNLLNNTILLKEKYLLLDMKKTSHTSSDRIPSSLRSSIMINSLALLDKYKIY